ncbi:hypothetical protein U6N30_00320 [Blastococcus brunescens]|uniref:Uncharacterized protein n=1 Tax=Blastococcus brunescens TaxID=1564165 RepID=A0ABZ1B3P9_9ACTN|nr:hypothetical protein [Blastococcus sp. BMG 8361]WRL64351.1 hypothetical protein U6N30_00320 [Blastococcus sp. BMG 8361]
MASDGLLDLPQGFRYRVLAEQGSPGWRRATSPRPIPTARRPSRAVTGRAPCSSATTRSADARSTRCRTSTASSTTRPPGVARRPWWSTPTAPSCGTT